MSFISLGEAGYHNESGVPRIPERHGRHRISLMLSGFPQHPGRWLKGPSTSWTGDACQSSQLSASALRALGHEMLK